MRHLPNKQDFTSPIRNADTMLRLSKLTDYAVVVLLAMAERVPEPASAGVRTSPCLAGATGVPEPTVAKVLKALSAAGLVASLRGARGGYRLMRPLEDISVADVVTAVDGPIALAACIEGAASPCDVHHACAAKGQWQLVNDAVCAALGAISLADMREAAVPPLLRPPGRAAAPLPFSQIAE